MQAIAELGSISERRTMRLTDESSNVRELPAFLAEHGGVNSGFMIVQVSGCLHESLSHKDPVPGGFLLVAHLQYTAAALVTENKVSISLNYCIRQWLEFLTCTTSARFWRTLRQSTRSRHPRTSKITCLWASRRE